MPKAIDKAEKLVARSIKLPEDLIDYLTKKGKENDRTFIGECAHRLKKSRESDQQNGEKK